ncbi:MAG: DUF6164 family protein [Rudaea sp.]
MAHLLLNLYQVLEDEADEVRALLDRHRIEFYETQPSRWGISHGGIWISHDDAFVQARQVLAEYEAQRGARVRAEYSAARQDGSAPTLWTTLREQPWRVALVLIGILFALALVVLPVLSLRG